MSRGNNVRGPTSALTEFLRESGITPTTIARRARTRVSQLQQEAGPSNTVPEQGENADTPALETREVSTIVACVHTMYRRPHRREPLMTVTTWTRKIPQSRQLRSVRSRRRQSQRTRRARERRRKAKRGTTTQTIRTPAKMLIPLCPRCGRGTCQSRQ